MAEQKAIANKFEGVIDDPLRLLDALSKQVQGNTPRPSKALNNFMDGMRRIEAHDWAAAETSLAAALSAAQADNDKTEGKNHEDLEKVAISCLGLGYLYTRTEPAKLAEAEVLYRKSLQTWMQIHGKESAKLLELMSDISRICEAAGKYDEAHNWLRRCDLVAKAKCGSESLVRAKCLIALGAYLCKPKVNKPDKAEKCFKAAISFCNKLQGKDSKVVLIGALLNYVTLLRALHRDDEAEKYEAKAKALSR